MDVDTAVAAALVARPNLCATRADALMLLFSSDTSAWAGGALSDRALSGRVGWDDAFVDEDAVLRRAALAAPLHDASAAMRREAAGRVRVRRENSRRAFVLHNAALIALDDGAPLTAVPFLGRKSRFDDMPWDVRGDWLAAARSLARAVLAWEGAPSEPLWEDVPHRSAADVQAAKAACGAFLARAGASGPLAA